MPTSSQHDDRSPVVNAHDEAEADSTTHAVVVGVDGSDANQDAVRWALAEAKLLHVPLRLIHVVSEELDRAAHFDRVVIHEEVQSILLDAQSTTKTVREDLTVVGEELVGSPANTLIEASRHARVVVVGRRGRGTFGQLLLGSVSTAVAARALVPAVVVPSGWDRAAHDDQPVVVGVDHHMSSPPLQEAFARADVTSRKLRVVYVWEAVAVYGRDVAAMGGNYHRWHEDALRLIDEATASLRAAYPRVVVTSVPRHGQVVAALVEESADAQCLVVGGRRHRALTGAMIGSTAIAALHHATSPVVVVHEA
jgi:nucleotide-binding universal stress UspA family protein